jgi:hypothetical protein
MPLQTPVPGIPGDQVDKITHTLGGDRGWVTDPRGRRYTEPGSGVAPKQTINIPGWDSIIKLGPRVATTGPDWSEYYKAQREGRAPNLPGNVIAEIDRLAAMSAANESSAQPEWAKTFGQVMTTIDNIQDFASTIATAGRLALWAGPKILDPLLPGASAASAELAGKVAAREYAAKLAAQLGGRAGWNKAFIDRMAAGIAARVTARAALGFGARIALRAIPVVGWVVLAADVLNFMNLLGTVAMPLYALICRTPQEFLAAGLPALALKNVLCKEVWTMARRNPFGREARAARRLASLGRLPTVSNLVEVVQTTDTLWGWGASFGSLYGAAMETTFALATDPTLANTRVNFDQAMISVGFPYVERMKAMSEAKRTALLNAGRVAHSAPAVLTKHDLVDDETHFLTMATLLGAYGDLYEFFHDGPHAALLDALCSVETPAPSYCNPRVLHQLGGKTADDAGIGRWPVLDNPRTLHPDILLPALSSSIAEATRDFLRPRRNRAEAAFYADAVAQCTDYGWMLATHDEHFLKWNLTTPSKVWTGLAVDGLLIPPYTPEPIAWKFWQGLCAQVEDRGGKLIHRADVERIAKATGAPLVKLLNPTDPLPDATREWLEHGPREPPTPS